MRTLLACCLVTTAACAPTQLVSTMSNPARLTDKKIESTQEYEVGPYKENHRYQVTLADWTPTSIAVRVKLVDTDQCAQPASYTFALIDEAGASHPFRAAGAPALATEKGRNDTDVTVATFSGDFAATIGPDSKTVTVQMRPVPNLVCPKIDFVWNLH